MAFVLNAAPKGRTGFHPLVWISARFAGYRAYRAKMQEFELVSDDELLDLNISQATLREIAEAEGRRREAEVRAAA